MQLYLLPRHWRKRPARHCCLSSYRPNIHPIYFKQLSHPPLSFSLAVILSIGTLGLSSSSIQDLRAQGPLRPFPHCAAISHPGGTELRRPHSCHRELKAKIIPRLEPKRRNREYTIVRDYGAVRRPGLLRRGDPRRGAARLDRWQVSIPWQSSHSYLSPALPNTKF